MKQNKSKNILATAGTRPTWGLAVQPSSSASRRGRNNRNTIKTKHTKLAPQTTSPVVQLKPTRTTKKAVQTIGLSIGQAVLQFIAQEFPSHGQPFFEQDGLPKQGMDDVLRKLALEGLDCWLEIALVDGDLDRDVLNQTRHEMGLAPLT